MQFKERSKKSNRFVGFPLEVIRPKDNGVLPTLPFSFPFFRTFARNFM